MTFSQLEAYKIFEADRVKLPYIFLAGLFLFIALLVYLSKLPEIKEPSTTVNESTPEGYSIFKHKHLIMGILGIFLYVGAQEGIAAFIIRFMQYLQIPGVNERGAASYISAYWFTFMSGRFIGAWLLSNINEHKLLATFAGVCGLLSLLAFMLKGMPAIYCVVAIGFFNSIQFPAIFAMSLKNLGGHTKIGSSLLVMAICGAGIVPAVMGYISTVSNIQMAFAVPVLCYLYVLYFALIGSKTAVKPV
jgi:FHS family L-fucose permease-like MFS transporter